MPGRRPCRIRSWRAGVLSRPGVEAGWTARQRQGLHAPVSHAGQSSHQSRWLRTSHDSSPANGRGSWPAVAGRSASRAARRRRLPPHRLPARGPPVPVAVPESPGCVCKACPSREVLWPWLIASHKPPVTTGLCRHALGCVCTCSSGRSACGRGRRATTPTSTAGGSCKHGLAEVSRNRWAHVSPVLHVGQVADGDTVIGAAVAPPQMRAAQRFLRTRQWSATVTRTRPPWQMGTRIG